MTKHRKALLSDLASGLREVNRSHAELAGLIRELELNRPGSRRHLRASY